MTTVYQIKIQLVWFKPFVYRTLLVKPSINLEVLHNYIQQLFGFENMHLYGFYDKKNDIYIVMNEEEKYEWNEKIAKNVKLKDVLQTEKDKILYTYDFGDNWEFNIKLEKIVETDEKLPKVLRWKWWYLIEDCGWVWGLEELIEIYKKKDKKGAENMWYDEFEYLEEELNNTIFKEIDWKDFELSDKLEWWVFQ